MKKDQRYSPFLPLIIAVSIALAFTACSKSGDPGGNNNSSNSGNNNNGSGGSNGSGGNSTATLTYVNNTYTPISIQANNQTQTIAVGGNLVYSGTPGTNFAATASTSGKTSSGAQVGLSISWNLNNDFPSSGNFTTNLNAGASVFFLRLINSSSLDMTGVYVNYGLQAQTLDNIIIPRDGKTYDIGYYNAYSNSNVRAFNGNTYWSWANLALSGQANQSITLTGN